MLIFLGFSVALTAIACLAVLLPFLRGQPGDLQGPRDIDVYRQQLSEIDGDEARGLIGAAEAAEARAELGRRILRSAEHTGRPLQAPGAGRWPALIAIAAIPLLSVGLYAISGSPGLSDQPLAARLERDPGTNTLEELVARAERHLAATPEDGTGWNVLAPIYLRAGRFAESAEAYRKAIALLGADADRLAGLGEALVAGAGGAVNAEARRAFEQAYALEAGHEKSQFFLALAHAQAGNLAEAEAAWRAMIANGRPGSPWPGLARRALGENAATREGSVGEDGEAIPLEAMSSEERSAAIEGMVESLAARLADNPDDPEGWERLIRSYVVLGKRDMARAALDRGRMALAGEPSRSGRLEALARELRLIDG